jgi:hypothetical protein
LSARALTSEVGGSVLCGVRYGVANTLRDMRSGSRRSDRDYLAIVSVTIVGIFLLSMLGLAVSMVVVQRWHVAAERAVQGEHVALKQAHERCETNKPPLATGWTLNWNATAQMFTCIYDRNGRRLPTGS